MVKMKMTDNEVKSENEIKPDEAIKAINSAEEKRRIRRDILSVRNAQPPMLRKQKSDKILQTIYSIEEYKNAKVILAYADYQSEVMTSHLIEKALFDGKEVFCPKVSGSDMDFYHIRSLEDLEEGYKGIREPVPGENLWDRKNDHIAHTADKTGRLLVIVPGVAFDKDCHRIGYGKGFYDKFMTRLSENELDFYAVGLGYECQIIPEVPCDKHDVCIDMIVTENNIYRRVCDHVQFR